MKILKNCARQALLGGVAILSMLLPAASQAQDASGPVEGLWKYTGLVSSSGDDMPLTGIFLLSEGKFLQQAVFDGEPFGDQRAMAHSGTYRKTENGVQLKAGQTLGLAPMDEESLSDAGVTEHELDVAREGQNMTLVFGSGTVQTLEKLSDASGAEIYALEKGMLAFADGYFIVVNGDGDRAVTGYGRYRREGERWLLDVVRWSEAAGALAQNLRDVTLSARFDGKTLMLADGRSFPVKR
ncbi:MAG: hypothetical protein ACK5HY_09350 [Parahaliea sp.]